MSRAQSATRQRSGEAFCCSEGPKDQSGHHFEMEGAQQSEPFGEKSCCWGQDQDLAELQSLCADRRKFQKATAELHQSEPVCVSRHSCINFAVELTPVEWSRSE